MGFFSVNYELFFTNKTISYSFHKKIKLKNVRNTVQVFFLNVFICYWIHNLYWYYYIYWTNLKFKQFPTKTKNLVIFSAKYEIFLLDAIDLSYTTWQTYLPVKPKNNNKEFFYCFFFYTNLFSQSRSNFSSRHCITNWRTDTLMRFYGTIITENIDVCFNNNKKNLRKVLEYRSKFLHSDICTYVHM